MISADRDYGSADIELDLVYDKANRVTSVTESGYAPGQSHVLGGGHNFFQICSV